MLIISKFPKRIAGRRKGLHVFETPDLKHLCGQLATNVFN